MATPIDDLEPAIPVRRGPPPTGNPGTGPAVGGGSSGGGGGGWVITFPPGMTAQQIRELYRDRYSGPYAAVDRLVPMPDPSTAILDRSTEINPRFVHLEELPRRRRALLVTLLVAAALAVLALYLTRVPGGRDPLPKEVPCASAK